MTVSLKDIDGQSVFTQELEPQRGSSHHDGWRDGRDDRRHGND
jgi:hypothetical protein